MALVEMAAAEQLLGGTVAAGRLSYSTRKSDFQQIEITLDEASRRAPRFRVSPSMVGNGYPRLTLSFARENISTREGSALDRVVEAPDFCISRRMRAKVFRTSVDALGT